MKRYWRRRGEEVDGPFRLDRLKAMWAAGDIRYRDDFRLDGQEAWIEAEQLTRPWERRKAFVNLADETGGRLISIGIKIMAICAALAGFVGLAYWIAIPSKLKYGPVIPGGLNKNQEPKAHGRQWNDLAGVFEEVGFRVIRNGDDSIMRVVVTAPMAAGMTDYQLKALAQQTQQKLGTYTTVTFEDEFGNPLSKASMWGASSSR